MEDSNFFFTDGAFLKGQPIQSPEAVIQEFYTIYSLEHVQVILWKMFKGAMSTELQIFNLPEENDFVIFFLENFLLLNMAVYELSQRANNTSHIP